ncbi:MAG: esterase/lipase family protein [Phycisphaerales bacterium]
MNRRNENPPRILAIALAVVGTSFISFAGWRSETLPALLAQAEPAAVGIRWFHEERWQSEAAHTPADIVLLVHGLDEPGGIWDALAPELAQAGHYVARFDYPNDQPVTDSTDLLQAALPALASLGVERIRVVAHSMGGLVTRDLITRPKQQGSPSVPLLITLGTPHLGSPWARWQPIAEAREQIQRWAESPDLDPALLFGWNADGMGEAGDDLHPTSAFLKKLNGRPTPTTTRIVCVVAVVPDIPLNTPLTEIPEFARKLGDGVVPTDSATLPGASRTILVRANHRSMVRPVEIGAWLRRTVGAAPPPMPPAIPHVLEELAGTQPSQTHP